MQNENSKRRIRYKREDTLEQVLKLGWIMIKMKFLFLMIELDLTTSLIIGSITLLCSIGEDDIDFLYLA